MSKSTTVRAISHRTGVKPREVLSALSGFGITGKQKYSNRIDKSISSKLENQLALPYYEPGNKVFRQTVFEELDEHYEDIFAMLPESITEFLMEPDTSSPATVMEENCNAQFSDFAGWLPVSLVGEPLNVVEFDGGMARPETNKSPAFSSQAKSAASPYQASVSNLDRYFEEFYKAASMTPADVEERLNRLRCINNLAIIQKLLTQIGIPSRALISENVYNERGEFWFDVYRRILFKAIGPNLVRDLNLQTLLPTARNFRNAAAHFDSTNLSAETTRWIADGLQNLALDLMHCYLLCFTEFDDRFMGNPTDYFYRVFKIRLTRVSARATAIQ